MQLIPQEKPVSAVQNDSARSDEVRRGRRRSDKPSLDAGVRLKVPPSVALCPGDGGELTTDGKTLKCRTCSGVSLLAEWNRSVLRFVRGMVRKLGRV